MVAIFSSMVMLRQRKGSGRGVREEWNGGDILSGGDGEAEKGSGVVDVLLHDVDQRVAEEFLYSCRWSISMDEATCFINGVDPRGSQKISKTSIGIVSAVWLAAAICFFVALPHHSWLWLINIFNSIQVLMTLIKYIPQAVMNFRRKSTDGFSIGNILLDFLGGCTSYGQMISQSIDQNSWVNFYGNIGKTLLSLVSIFFDLLIMCQHYLLYPNKKAVISCKLNKDGADPLLKSFDHPESENV